MDGAFVNTASSMHDLGIRCCFGDETIEIIDTECRDIAAWRVMNAIDLPRAAAVRQRTGGGYPFAGGRLALVSILEIAV